MPSEPKTFISYSWDDSVHKSWIREFATRLRGNGVDVKLDQWHAAPGDQLPVFMETAVRESDFVLIICTPNYRRKSNARDGGVGYEGDVMTGEIFTEKNHSKFLPILRSGERNDSIPSWLKGRYYIDLRGTPYSEVSYRDLLNTLHDARPDPPAIGPRPIFASVTPTPSNPARATVSVAGLALIIDEIAGLVSDIEYVGYTFGESRRILMTISRLHGLIEGAIIRNKNSLTEETTEELRDFVRAVETFISEANYTLPYPNENKYTRDREHLKQDKSQVRQRAITVKSLLLNDPALSAEFEEIKVSDTLIWNELGYKDKKQFSRYISPHSEEMLGSAGEIELTLIEDILVKGSFIDSAMHAEGYPKEILVEVMNALLRDKYLLTRDFHEFTFTSVGKRIVSRLLAQKRKDS